MSLIQKVVNHAGEFASVSAGPAALVGLVVLVGELWRPGVIGAAVPPDAVLGLCGALCFAGLAVRQERAPKSVLLTVPLAAFAFVAAAYVAHRYSLGQFEIYAPYLAGAAGFLAASSVVAARHPSSET